MSMSHSTLSAVKSICCSTCHAARCPHKTDEPQGQALITASRRPQQLVISIAPEPGWQTVGNLLIPLRTNHLIGGSQRPPLSDKTRSLPLVLHINVQLKSRFSRTQVALASKTVEFGRNYRNRYHLWVSHALLGAQSGPKHSTTACAPTRSG